VHNAHASVMNRCASVRGIKSILIVYMCYLLDVVWFRSFCHNSKDRQSLHHTIEISVCKCRESQTSLQCQCVDICWGVQNVETVCLCLVQSSFVMRHQSAVVCVATFLAGMMLTSSFVLIFSQHINIVQVVTLTHCLVVLSLFSCL